MRVVARVEHSEQLEGYERKVFFGAVDAQLLDDLNWMWARGQYCPDWLNPSIPPHEPLVVAASLGDLREGGLERNIFKEPECKLPGGRDTPDFDTGPWFELLIESEGGIPVTLYPDLVGEDAVPAAISEWRHLDANESFVLDEHFSLKHLGTMDSNQIGTALRRPEAATWATVFDVGQGSCAALRDDAGAVLVYVDLGGGVMANAKTFPHKLRTFCFGSEPLIVLSHWDWDHYSSARRDPWAYQQHWLVPYQEDLGPVAIRHAADILAHGGQVQVWPATFCGDTERFGIHQCNGTSRNDSGLAVTFNLGGGARALFPGDADYSYLPEQAGKAARCLVVTHHGAEMRTQQAPRADALPGSRLVYSYGAGNQWEHPRTAAFEAHQAAGWPPHSPDGPSPTVRWTATRAHDEPAHVPLLLGPPRAQLCCRVSIPDGAMNCDLCPAPHQY